MELVGVISIYDANGNLVDFLIGDREDAANVSNELKVPIDNLSNFTIEYKAVEPEKETYNIARRLFAKITNCEKKKSD